MLRLSRRSFLAASAGALAAPVVRATAAPAATGEVDVAIVGAGAAGIAAGRRIVAAGQRIALIEAADRVGGRCITDTSTFGLPVDRGAHWIHTPDINPLAKLAPRPGFDIYPSPPGQKLRIGRRNAREGEMEDFLSALVRSNRAIADAVTRGKTDVSCAQALPRDLGEWRAPIEFVLGPYGSGKDLNEVSALDLSKSAERDSAAFCRQGFGALLARLAQNLPVQVATPVTRIDWSRGLDVETDKGRIAARAVIVTVSTNVLTAGKIKFTPELPRRQIEAAARLKLGSYDHIVLELAGNPLELQNDDLVFEKSERPRTAALLANMSGTALAMLEVGGNFGRDLSAQGQPAMVAFASDWLAQLFGADIRKAIKRTSATRWNEEPWVLGAWSAATPGNQSARRTLAEALGNKIWFAGEAVHETLWGTVGGAWESGERTADAVLRRLGVLKEPQQPQQPKPPPAKTTSRRRR